METNQLHTTHSVRRSVAALLMLGLALSGCSPSLTPKHSEDTVPSSGASASISEQSCESETESSAPALSLLPDPEESSPALETSQEGSVLLFASDYQHRDGWEDPPVTLTKVLDAVYDAGVRPDNYIFCGDYTALDGKNNYNADPHDAVEEIKGICTAHDSSLDTDEMIFVQGNHDLLTTDLSTAGLHDFGDYLVYVLNTETEYPWGQGKYKRREQVQLGAQRLEHCLKHLIQAGETRPIFLAGHVPLHFSGRSSPLQGTGDNVYSRELFQVIQAAGEDLNIIYLYGHNHSRGWDSYLGGSCVFRRSGDELLVPNPRDGESVTSDYTAERLNFTYLNAGYVGYFSSAGGEDTLCCTVCEIHPDHLVFTRYDENGVHLLSAEGTPNPAKDDRKLIPSFHYGEVIPSPQEVELITHSDFAQKKAA